MDLLTIPEQVAKIQAQLNLTAPQYNVVRMPINMAELEAVIKRVFSEQIGELSKSQVVGQSNVGSIASELLTAIGSALNEEQQLWLSNSDNQDKIIDFLTSPNGQALTRRFYTMYKDYKEAK